MNKLQAKSLKMFISQIKNGQYSNLKMTHNAKTEKLSIEVARFCDDIDAGDNAVKLQRATERAQELLDLLPPATCDGFIYKKEITRRRYQGFLNSVCVVVE